MTRALVCLLVASCGGTDPSDFDEGYANARCAHLQKCGLFADLEACHAYFDRTAIDNPSPAAAVDADKLDYDEGAAHDCFTAVANLSCDTSTYTGHELDVCDDVFTGNLDMGDACAFDAECKSDHCIVPSCPDTCCKGTCGAPRTLPAIGEACSSECVDGALCGLDGNCHAALAVDSECFDPLICGNGTYCRNWTPTVAGVCTALPKRGDACETICANIGDACTGTCVAMKLPGEACNADIECSTFYRCDESKHCAPDPTIGQACTDACSDESWCNAGTCDARKADGATCMRSDECTSHYCDGTCMAVPLCI